MLTLSSGTFDASTYNFTTLNYSQTDGSFTGSGGTITVNQNFTVTGGAFNAASSTLKMTALLSGCNDTIYALTTWTYNGTTYLVAGGSFTTIGGSTISSIAKWNGSSWTSLGTATGTNGDVRALTTYGGNLIAGGVFTTIGGSTISSIAQWNGSSWTSLGTATGTNNYVYALTTYGGNLIAGGGFTTIGGSTINRIAKWDGSSWTSLGTAAGANSPIYALTTYAGNLIAGGGFVTISGSAIWRIAKWNGSSWTSLGTANATNATVYALTIYGSSLIAGGQFTRIGGSTISYIAQWNGSSWTSFGTATGTNSFVYALTTYSGNLIAGGWFTTIGGSTISSIAQWNGSSWASIGTASDVQALTTYAGNLIAGGGFTTIGGSTISRIAQWNGSGWAAVVRPVITTTGVTLNTNLNLDTYGSTTILADALTLSGNLTITSGTLDADGKAISLTGNWSNFGIFTSGSGTVTFDGAGNQSVSGSTVFHNLTISGNTVRTVTVAAGTTQSVSGALILGGAAGQLLSLRSTQTGNAAQLLLDGDSGTQSISYVDVMDINANGGQTLLCFTGTAGCIDSGNNTNWNFISSTSIAFVSSLNPSTYQTNVTLTATVTPASATGSLTFKNGGSIIGSAMISHGSGAITIGTLAIGSHALTVEYGGSSHFYGSVSSTLTQTVHKANSAMVMISSLNPSTFGSGITLTTTLTPSTATGTLTFKDGSITIGSATIGHGSGSMTTTLLGGGTHAIAAQYSGDANYSGSVSDALAQTVIKGVTSTVVLSSLHPSRYNQTIVFSANVLPASATGVVSFRDGGIAFGTGVIAGGTASVTSAALVVGTHTITAVYGGNSNYFGSLSDPLSQQVIYVTGTGTALGRVWDDHNGNGLKESGETDGIEHVTVTLSGQTTTGAALSFAQSTALSGDYRFSDILRSNEVGYTVAADLTTVPSGWIRTTATSSGGIVLGTGAVKTVNFGFVRASTLSGSVFLDVNGNSVRDVLETRSFSGITLTLTGTSATGGVIGQSVKTDENGVYIFSGLPAASGSFLLVSGVPRGYLQTTTASRSVVITVGGQRRAEYIGFSPLPVPVVSNVEATVTASVALITWSTNQEGSSLVEYSPDGGTLTATPETDSGTLTTDHAVMIDDLPSCVVFRFRVRSRDFLLQEGTSEESTFDMAGCPGLAEILAETGALMTAESGGTLGLTGTGYAMTLSVPEGAVEQMLTFQMTELDPLTVAEALTPPAGKIGVERFFTLTALSGATTQVRTFEKPLTITMRYTADDIAGIDEATLAIWRNDETEWTELSECAVDTIAKTVTCETDHFSTFAMFGDTFPGTESSPSIPATAISVPASENRRARPVVAATSASEVTHPSSDSISIDIFVPVKEAKPVLPVFTEEQKSQLKIVERQHQIREQKARVQELQMHALERRTARLEQERMPVAIGPSFWERMIDSFSAIFDSNKDTFTGIVTFGHEAVTGIIGLGHDALSSTIAFAEHSFITLSDKTIAFTQNIIAVTQNGWHSLIASGQSLAHSIISRFDAREQIAAVRKSMEQSLIKYSTALKNDNGRLVLAQLKITLLSPDGSPYAHAPVVLFSDPVSAVTDVQGTVIFQNVEIREHRLEIHTFKGDVQQRKISLTASAPASAVGKKGVVVSIPEVRIIVDESNLSPFGRLSPLFFALWSLGILAIGTGGGMYGMYRYFALAKRRR